MRGRFILASPRFQLWRSSARIDSAGRWRSTQLAPDSVGCESVTFNGPAVKIVQAASAPPMLIVQSVALRPPAVEGP